VQVHLTAGFERVEYVATSLRLCESEVRLETHTVPVRKEYCTVHICSQKLPKEVFVFYLLTVGRF
jgi:hypothetical protein